jgi:hypothetical protein
MLTIQTDKGEHQMICKKIGGLVLATFIFLASGLSNAEQIPGRRSTKLSLERNWQ